MKFNLYLSVLIVLSFISCQDEDFDNDEVVIPDFNFEKSITFEDSLSSYELFKGNPSDLIPNDDFELLELSSVLFTDYAHKQRLVKIPEGSKMQKQNDGSIEFPNGTILTKTFFYFLDERDTSLGKNIIETRLEIKANNLWNIATYIWVEDQNEAILALDGMDKKVEWINSTGNTLSTQYHIPTENECMTCHQTNASLAPIGPSVLNLNRMVTKDGQEVNQLSYLQARNLLSEFPVQEENQMVDYTNPNAPLSTRGRAYLAMNCAHCHNPSAWNIPAEKNFDFRYNTSFSQSGIGEGADKIRRNFVDREMPFIGTTMLDEEGLTLIIQYLESL